MKYPHLAAADRMLPLAIAPGAPSASGRPPVPTALPGISRLPRPAATTGPADLRLGGAR
jgi:hypothetical protein